MQLELNTVKTIHGNFKFLRKICLVLHPSTTDESKIVLAHHTVALEVHSRQAVLVEARTAEGLLGVPRRGVAPLQEGPHTAAQIGTWPGAEPAVLHTVRGERLREISKALRMPPFGNSAPQWPVFTCAWPYLLSGFAYESTALWGRQARAFC